MARDYSSEGLLTFLREETVARRLHPATARSRRKAAEALFAFLEAPEKADLRVLDLAALARRIHEGPSSDLRPELVDLYTQRLSAALADYLDANPLRIAAPTDTGAAPARQSVHNANAEDSASDNATEARALEAVRLSFDRYRADVLPIPLERGRVVYLHGIPTDLSAAEARRISKIVQAFATDEETPE